jgi:hypothetical protein
LEQPRQERCLKGAKTLFYAETSLASAAVQHIFFLTPNRARRAIRVAQRLLTNPLIPRSQRPGSHGEETMKIRSLLALVGLAISLALPAFAQQTNAPDPQLRQQILPLSVIGRWSQTFKGHKFDPIQLDGHEVDVWKKRMLMGLNWLRFRPIWSLPSKFLYSTLKAPMTSLLAKK